MAGSKHSLEISPEIVATIGFALLLEQQESCGPHGQISASSTKVFSRQEEINQPAYWETESMLESAADFKDPIKKDQP